MTLENLKTSLVLATGAGVSVFGGLQYLNKYYSDKSWSWLVTAAWAGIGASISSGCLTYGRYMVGGKKD